MQCLPKSKSIVLNHVRMSSLTLDGIEVEESEERALVSSGKKRRGSNSVPLPEVLVLETIGWDRVPLGAPLHCWLGHRFF